MSYKDYPYRQGLVPYTENETSFIVRLWRRIFGALIYTGKETCGHCKYWKKPKGVLDYLGDFVWHYEPPKEDWEGDCKLIYSHNGRETTKDDTCDRYYRDPYTIQSFILCTDNEPSLITRLWHKILYSKCQDCRHRIEFFIYCRDYERSTVSAIRGLRNL